MSKRFTLQILLPIEGYEEDKIYKSEDISLRVTNLTQKLDNIYYKRLKEKSVYASFDDVVKFVNIPDDFPSAVRQNGNHFLDSFLCILNHNFYENIGKGCYAPQMRQGLDQYPHRNV